MVLAAVGAGCAEIRVPPAHSIVAHKEGYPIDHTGRPGDWRPLTAEEFRAQFIDEIRAGIDRYVAEAAAAGRPARLLVFVHGGLNTYRAALGRVRRLLDAQQDHARHPALASYYLLFVNWNSSLFSSLWDSLFIVRRGERNPLAAVPTSPFVLGGQLVGTGIAAPSAWAAQVENAVDSFGAAEKAGEREQTRVLVGLGYFAAYPVRALSVPFIQGFGMPAWEMMKRRADLVVADTRTTQSNPYADRGAARTLLEGLRARLCTRHDARVVCERPDGRSTWAIERQGETRRIPVEVTLAGHSMGTMVVDRILQLFPEVAFDHVVHLAAASSIDDFEQSVLPYLRQHPRTRFWGFSLSDSDESRESGSVDLWERGSLLVWIDNFFERLVTPTQRTVGRYRNYHRRYKALPDEERGALCIRKFAGRAGEPRAHGDFDEPEVLETILGKVQAGACPDGDFW